jgi:hypothetical protein
MANLFCAWAVPLKRRSVVTNEITAAPLARLRVALKCFEVVFMHPSLGVGGEFS